MKVAVLFSGGKDSTLAMSKAAEEGHEVRLLVSLLPDNPDSYMFHYPNAIATVIQARAAGLRIITKKTEGTKEEELEDLEDVLDTVKGEVDGVVTGAIASGYQGSRIGNICGKLGLKAMSPLWDMTGDEIWDSVLKRGIRAVMTAVACDGLGKGWLGREIDEESLEELKKLSEKHKFHVAGEGGEFETFVLDAPVFRKRIEIKKARKEWDEKTGSGFYMIDDVRLVDK